MVRRPFCCGMKVLSLIVSVAPTSVRSVISDSSAGPLPPTGVHNAPARPLYPHPRVQLHHQRMNLSPAHLARRVLVGLLGSGLLLTGTPSAYADRVPVLRFTANDEGSDASASESGNVLAYVHADDSGSSVVVWNRSTGRKTVISPVTANTDSDDVWNVQVSGNGAVVWYATNHPGVDPAVADNQWHLYRYDLATSTTAAVTDGTGRVPRVPATLSCRSVDASGRFAVLRTPTSLVSQDTNALSDLYLYDAQSATFTLISHGPGGKALGAAANCPSVTRDGQLVAWMSVANGIVKNDTDRRRDVFVWRQSTERNTLFSTGSLTPVDNPSIAGRGTWIVFATRGTSRFNRNVYRSRTTHPHPVRVLHNLPNDGEWGADYFQSAAGRYCSSRSPP